MPGCRSLAPICVGLEADSGGGVPEAVIKPEGILSTRTTSQKRLLNSILGGRRPRFSSDASASIKHEQGRSRDWPRAITRPTSLYIVSIPEVEKLLYRSDACCSRPLVGLRSRLLQAAGGSFIASFIDASHDAFLINCFEAATTKKCCPQTFHIQRSIGIFYLQANSARERF